MLRALGSLQLAIALLVAVASVLSWATLLEASWGREAAEWYVYGRAWFVLLLGLLGLNILAATLTRWPWKRHQAAFVVTHGGLLVLLAGSLQTLLWGVNGQIVLREGQHSDRLRIDGRSRIQVVEHREPKRLATEFTFAPGPADWQDGERLDFGDFHGLGLAILKFYRHARAQTAWVADPVDFDGPALKLRLGGPSGNTVAEDWLAGGAFGGEAVIGPTASLIWPLPLDTMLEDFVSPPTELGNSGILSAHYGGRMYRIPIDGNVGGRVPLADSGIEIEIVAYFRDAKPAPDGSFFSRSDRPRNPLVELKIHEPGQRDPRRQVAFAKRPLLTLDGVYGNECPVRFWYHHAGLPVTPGAVFAQTPDGRLYHRAAIEGVYSPASEVHEGGRIPIGGQFHLALLRYLPRARQEVSFYPVQPAAEALDPADAARPAEAAVLVELTVDGRRRQIWLQRDDLIYGRQTIWPAQPTCPADADQATSTAPARGPITLVFEYDQLPLGYTLELAKVLRVTDPGGASEAGFGSRVRLLDAEGAAAIEGEIWPNKPLSHGAFTIYQAGVEDAGHGTEASRLAVARDPGRGAKYAGSLMICVGILAMFFLSSGRSRAEIPAAPTLPAGDAPVVAGDPLEPQTPAVPDAVAPRRRSAAASPTDDRGT